MDEDYNYTRSPAWEELVITYINVKLHAGLKNEQDQTGLGLR